MISNWRRFSRWPAQEQQRMQDKLLSSFLREDLAPFHPYYRRIFQRERVDVADIETVADLAALPFTTKQDIIAAMDEDPGAFVLQPREELIRTAWPLDRLLPLAVRRFFKGSADVRRILQREYMPVFMTATTGRAARPVPFLYTKADMRRLAVTGRRLANVLGVQSASDRLLNVFPYAPHLGFWQVAFAGFEAGVMILSTGGGKTIGTAGNLGAIRRLNPTGIIGVPAYIFHLLRLAEAERISLGGLRMIILGAEKVSDTLREKLLAMAERCGAGKVHIMGTYGFTEAKMAWSECPGGTGYHLYPDMGIFEIVDPFTGDVKGEGESGEIVFTSLESRGSTVLRYRTGDYAEGGITREPCPYCGRTVPRLSSRIRRLTDRTDVRLTKLKGTLVDLNHVSQVLSGTPEIEEWQVEFGKVNDDPDELDVVTVYVAPARNMTIDQEKLASRIFEVAEVAPNRIVVTTLEEMIQRTGLETEMKEKRFLDRRPR